MKKKKTQAPPVTDIQVSDSISRDVDMFKKWMSGATKESIAQEYGLSTQAIYDIARKNDWKGKRRMVKDAVYADVMTEVKDRAVELFGLLATDLGLLKQSAHLKKKKRQLTKEERQYAMKFLEICLHEQKLSEGKPTAITSGEQELRLVLPQGVEDAWVIPPDPRLAIQRETPETKNEDISPADFDEIVNAEKNKSGR
jgi:hypothetical protein